MKKDGLIPHLQSNTLLHTLALAVVAVVGWGPDSALASGNITHQVISDKAVGMMQNPQAQQLLRRHRDAFRTGILHPDVADHLRDSFSKTDPIINQDGGVGHIAVDLLPDEMKKNCTHAQGGTQE